MSESMASMSEQEFQAKIDEADGLLSRATLLVNDGDRVPYMLRASSTFMQGEANSGSDLIFNVPNDADFFGSRLNLYLASRIVSLNNPSISDLTFRPADWTSESDGDSLSELPIDKAGAAFEIRDFRGVYQTAPCMIQSAFSSKYSQEQQLVTPNIAGMDFHMPYRLPRGTSMTVKVFSTFSMASTSDLRREFRVTGILQGWKKVRAFK